MARPYRSVTSTVGRTLILPPRCMANTGSSVAVDGVDSNMGLPPAHVDGLTVTDGRGDGARVRETGGVPSRHCAIAPSGGGDRPEPSGYGTPARRWHRPRRWCNTRYRQQAITSINLPVAW